MREIYMDYNAATPIRREVLETLQEALEGCFGNASSVHSAGRRAKSLLDGAREKVAESLGCKPSEIVFTGGGSESDNLAIKGVAHRFGRGHIVTSSIEHPAVMEACRFLETRGFGVTFLPVGSSCRLEPEAVREAIRKDTILVSVMWANNETGVLQPIEAISEIAREKGILFHTDAVQAFGKVPVDMGSEPIDLLSISGHKFHAPKGVGALYVRKGVELEPVIHGGGQEKGRRSGTENVPLIAALGEACRLAVGDIESESKRLARLRNSLEEGILSLIPGTRVNGDRDFRVPNTSSITFQGVEGEAILVSLDEFGIAASSASACAAGHTDPSHVLLAMGLSREEAEGAMRFSLGRQSREEDIAELLGILPGIVERLRSIAPG